MATTIGADAAKESTLSHKLVDLTDKERRQQARRLLLQSAVFAPLLLCSLLTTKAVAQTKVVVTSVPISL